MSDAHFSQAVVPGVSHLRHRHCVVVIPVKPPAVGKSRLSDLPDRVALAEAFALDTLAACLASDTVAEVLVVTDDARFAARVDAAGIDAIPDGVTGDLNESLRQGAAEAVRRWPDLIPVALCADLPALRPADLDAALARVDGSAAFVADADGLGTTTYSARIEDFAPRFGADSAARHRASGARSIDGELSTLRRDVDSAADLSTATTLGVGPATEAVLRSRSLDR